jgi:hypothetical protein
MIGRKFYPLFALGCAVLLAVTVGGTAPAPAAKPPIATSAETSSRTIEDGGTGPYKAILAGDSSLATHTIFRPKDLGAFGEKAKLPIVAWGNGGCANSTNGFDNFLSEVASHGYLVIAIGPAQAGGARGGMGGAGGVGSTKSSQLLDAIDWAIAQNADKAGAYCGKIETSKVAVIGQSCGGLQALEVSDDPRISTTLVCNSGILNANTGAGGAAAAPAPATAPAARGGRGGAPGGADLAALMPPVTKDQLAKLHAPIIYILGGSADIAYANGTDDFKRIDKMPAFMANLDVGHGGTYARPHGGEFAPVATAWLDWQLKGDKEAGKLFTGDPCGLSKQPGWKVEKKNIP